MARRENEAVAIQPTGIARIMVQRVAIKNGSNLGRAKGQPEVARLGFCHGIHCQSTRIAGGQFESRNIKTHSEKASRGKKASCAEVGKTKAQRL
jgi:hypothetical protein